MIAIYWRARADENWRLLESYVYPDEPPPDRLAVLAGAKKVGRLALVQMTSYPTSTLHRLPVGRGGVALRNVLCKTLLVEFWKQEKRAKRKQWIRFNPKQTALF